MPRSLLAGSLVVAVFTATAVAFDDVDGSNDKSGSSGIVHLPRLYQDADQGSPLAQYLLGALYQVGEVIPRDDAEAVKWLRRAAEQGLAVAQFALGAAYARGEGLPQDSLQAHMWLSLSAAHAAQIAGSQKLVRDAQEMRDTVALKMTPEQIVQAEQLARGWRAKRER
jgi:TPR repeat protein